MSPVLASGFDSMSKDALAEFFKASKELNGQDLLDQVSAQVKLHTKKVSTVSTGTEGGFYPSDYYRTEAASLSSACN